MRALRFAPNLCVAFVACAAPSDADSSAEIERLEAVADRLETSAARLEQAAEKMSEAEGKRERRREELMARAAARRESSGGGLSSPDLKDPFKRGGDDVLEGMDDAISCEGDTCTIEKVFLDKALSSPEVLARQARIIPVMKDGEQRGYKMYGIRPSSLMAKLGFKNGDQLASVGGRELTSIDVAMELYTEFRDAKSLEFGIVRRGAPTKLTIKVK